MLPQTRLAQLIDDGKLVIYPVISPPRSGSTMMGASISHNPAIDGYCHEPFFNLKRHPENPELAYQAILDVYDKVAQPGVTRIVVKEMTQWLAIGEEYKTFFPMVKTPPLMLIRNPLLAIESRLRKLTETFAMRDKQSLQRQLESLVGTSEASKTPLSDAECSPYQLDLLNRYAMSEGFTDWSVFREHAHSTGNFVPFDRLLQDEDVFSLKGSGWEAFAVLLGYFKDAGIDYRIVDTTECQLSPTEIVSQICQYWGLDFDDEMVSWNEGRLLIDTGQNKPYQKIWYENLQSSRGIKPPQEYPNLIVNFPPFIADNLERSGLPLYCRFYKDPGHIKTKEDLSEKPLFPGYHDMPVKVRELDPIFAGLHRPSLMKDVRFVTDTIAYKRELIALGNGYQPQLAQDKTAAIAEAIKVVEQQVSQGKMRGEVVGSDIVLEYAIEG